MNTYNLKTLISALYESQENICYFINKNYPRDKIKLLLLEWITSFTKELFHKIMQDIQYEKIGNLKNYKLDIHIDECIDSSIQYIEHSMFEVGLDSLYKEDMESILEQYKEYFIEKISEKKGIYEG